MTYTSLTQSLYVIAVAVLAAGTLACLIRAIIGPSIADRLVAANMTGTQIICIICLIAAKTGEEGFSDVAIVYALLSFLAAAVLTRILSRKEKKQ